jgi:hypothetical protein
VALLRQAGSGERERERERGGRLIEVDKGGVLRREGWKPITRNLRLLRTTLNSMKEK